MRLIQYGLAFSLAYLLGGCAPQAASPALTSRAEVSAQVVRAEAAEPDAIQTRVQECEEFRKKIPAAWFQDWLVVPEDPSNPDGMKIRVFYYGKINPGTVPAIFFNGGPEFDSHSSFGIFRSELERVSLVPRFLNPGQKTSLVFIDQRGTGCSDAYPPGESSEVIKRLSHYGSQGIVSDAEHLRAKIWAGKKWIAVGQSYGAHIVHRYIMIAPEGLKAAFAHGNAITPNMDRRSINRDASQARVSEAYFSRFPSDRRALDLLAEFLTLDRCFEVESGYHYCGHGVLEPLSQELGFPDRWINIHQWLGAMVAREGVSVEAIRLFLSLKSEALNSPASSDYSHGVISWVDRGTRTIGLNSCQEARTLLLQQGIDLAKVWMSECASSFQYDAAHAEETNSPAPSDDPYAALRVLPRDLMNLESFRTRLQQYPGLAFYLYSGQLDPYVPVESFADENAAIHDLPNVHYLNFPDSGHDGYYSETWFWQDLIRESREKL